MRVLRYEIPYKRISGAYPEPLALPRGAQITAVGIFTAIPNPRVMIWALVAEDEPTMLRWMFFVQTGEPVPVPSTFIGTGVGASVGDVPYVAHVFESMFRAGARQRLLDRA